LAETVAGAAEKPPEALDAMAAVAGRNPVEKTAVAAQIQGQDPAVGTVIQYAFRKPCRI